MFAERQRARAINDDEIEPRTTIEFGPSDDELGPKQDGYQARTMDAAWLAWWPSANEGWTAAICSKFTCGLVTKRGSNKLQQ
ncbi:uncharacterized protein J3R85_001460 [Psidium guajava]|nr:uncharacterized protein J3R85_001460 [Psidium guajava]